MENNNLFDLQLRSSIISETNQGLEVAKQLKMNLKTLASLLSPAKDCDFLVNMIIESQNRVLSMLEHANGLQSMGRVNTTPTTTTTITAAPPPPNGSTLSDDSDMEDFKDDDKNISRSSKKRIATPRWSKRIYSRSASKSPLVDGHNWRKYGQKLITGAKHPRSYYRCTQRVAQGCLARRHVQRTNEDPTILQITYIREHTCKPLRSSKSASSPKNEQQLNVSSTQNNTINIIDSSMHHQNQHALIDDTKPQHFPNDLSFHYPPAPPSSNNNALTVENYPFSTPNNYIDENCYYPRILSPCREYYTDNYLNVQGTGQEMEEKASTSANIADMNLDYFSMFGPTSTFGNSGFFF